MNGWITIGTKLSTKDLEVDLKNLKKSLSDAERENKILVKTQAEDEEALRDIEAGKMLLEETMQEQLALLQTEEERNEYLKEYSDIMELVNLGYDKAKSDLEESNEKLKKNLETQDEIKRKIEETNQKLANMKEFDGISKGFDKIIGKVFKWGLALFGINSMYGLIRSSMSTLSQQDENMKKQLDYIRWTVANAIAPVVKFIINAMYLILQYVNQITKALFGFELFKGPKEFAKSMKSASGSAEKIRKSLAGFDEMNVLGDNTAMSGGASGVETPTFDTESVIETIDKVTKKAKELGNTFRQNTYDMVKALADPSAFSKAYGEWDKFMYGITQLFAGLDLTILGVVDVFKGIGKIIKGIIDGDKKLIWEGVKQTINGIFEIIYGLWLIVQGLTTTAWGVVKGLFITIVKWIYNNAIIPIGNFFKSLWDGIVLSVKGAVKNIKDAFNGIVTFFRNIIDKISGNFKKMGTKVGDAVGGAFKSVINAVLIKVEKMLNTPIKSINKLLNKINDVPGINIQKLNTITFPRLAKGTILNNPGKGVPIAVGGEAGREAVLPLSDSRLLEELGSTIGRYITINLTNETNLDGRTIARKVSQLNNNENFLRNR